MLTRNRVWIAAVALLLLAAFAGRSTGWFGGHALARLEGAPVKRGPLRIALTARGNLSPADSVSLRSEVEGRTTILSLVPEGTHVKQGDLVCELDATVLVDKRFQQSISQSNAEAALVKARQNFEIQESQNKSDSAQALQKLEFAQLDLKKYLEGERDSELEKSKEAIALAEEEAAHAEDKFGWSQKLAEKGFLTASELEGDRLERHRAGVALLQAKRDLDLLERFEIPRKESQLRAALEESQRERERVDLQARARIIDFEADVRTSEARFKLESDKLAKLEAQIEHARIRAPKPGLLIYAQRDSDEPPIQEGAEVREREEILTIPNAEGMLVQSKLHESVLKQVQIGQHCVVKVEALPGQPFEGRVASVALLPDQVSRWMNPNMRVYRADIALTTLNESLRPGMSCAVEILIEELPETLYVPVQSVFRRKQETLCFVSRAGQVEPRTVEVGRANELWVQILSGLAEGETVLLKAPADFEPGGAAEPKSGERKPGERTAEKQG
jgi:HlyD family secretion protein